MLAGPPECHHHQLHVCAKADYCRATCTREAPFPPGHLPTNHPLRLTLLSDVRFKIPSKLLLPFPCINTTHVSPPPAAISSLCICLTLLARVFLRVPQQAHIALCRCQFHKRRQARYCLAILQGVLPKGHQGSILGQQELKQNTEGRTTETRDDTCTDTMCV